ncbi:MAG TPA: amidohydrolase [Pirellulales bacterium]|jgi:hypothetical protein|nr:amidohydrolase [Pirellulales bacterium]
MLRATNLRTTLIATLLEFAFALAPGRGFAAEMADAIYHGGEIVTVDDRQPTAQALAVHDGKILAVGSLDDVMKLRGSETHVVDLAGKALLPGFIDPHSHYAMALVIADECKLFAPPSGPGKDVDSMIAALKQFAADRKIAPGEEIIGYGYDDTVMPQGRLLNRDDLDAAFPNNPVRVDHVSMHGTVLNSLAMQQYGFSAETKAPPGGVIVRKPGTNEPWGLIMETAFLPILEQTPRMTEQQEIAATKAGQWLYAEAGITTAHEGLTNLAQLRMMKRAADAGIHTIDVIAFASIFELDEIVAEFPIAAWGTYDQGLKIGGVKITIDGSPQGRTAAFTTPYLTGGPGGERPWSGELAAPKQTIDAAVKHVYDLGVPLNLHANGDAAIDAFLQAHEYAASGDLGRDRRVTLMHAQFTRKDQIAKFVDYKIRPSFYSLHTYYFADAHIRNRGVTQAMYISPMRDAIDAGLHPTNHTDFVVAPLDQAMVLWSAVNRISRAGNRIGPDQRITPLEALKAITLWPAEQYGEQDTKGSLAPGKRADMVILDRNPLVCPPLGLNELCVLETIKDGRTIYAAGADTPSAQ